MYRRNVAAVLLLAVAFLLSDCDASLPPLPSPVAGQGYALGTGDEVRITTFGEKDLSGDFTIGDSGVVALPLAGPVVATGLTSETLAAKIRDVLQAKKLLAEPNVVVEVVKYRPIFVLGEVEHPGPYPYQLHMNLLHAVALAGGFTPRALKRAATVVRSTASGTQQGSVDQLGEIEPGDIITVVERNF